MLDRIATAVRRAMGKKELTCDEIEARLAQARTELTARREALEQAEDEAEQLAVSKRLDDVALARQDKKLTEAREAVRRWSEQLQLLSRMFDAASKAQQDEAQRERFAKVAALCATRADLAAKLDAWAVEGGKLLDQFAAANGEVLQLLPDRPSDMPPMFTVDGLRTRVTLRLLAACPTVWTSPRLLSPWEAQKLPPLKAAATDERTRLLAQYTAAAEAPGLA